MSADYSLNSGLPASIESEKAILGSALLDNSLCDEVIAALRAEHFFLDSHRRIFNRICDLFETSRPIDIVTLTEELQKHKEIKAVGGAAYLSSLTDGAPRRSSLKHYVDIVIDKYTLRKMIHTANGIAAAAYDSAASADQVVSDAEASILNVAAEGDGEAVKIGDVTADVEKRILWGRSANKERTALELSWGISGLDSWTKGIFSGELTVLGGESGRGKLMDVDESIPTPKGFVRNGDLQDGDKIFGDDGMVYSVVKAHQVREEESYKVTFDDGSFTHVHGGHLWHTWTFRDRQKKFKQSDEFRSKRRESRPKRGTGVSPWTTKRNIEAFGKYIPPPVNGSGKTTLEIMNTLRVNNCERGNHSIPLAKPIQLPYRRLPIDPYVLGVWLGDGDSRFANITIGEKDETSICLQLAERGHQTRKKTCYVGKTNRFTFSSGDRSQKARDGSTQAVLRKIGVLENKHIPEEYLWASQTQRLELLRGLMDTDGTCNESGRVEFCNMNRDLARGVYHLAASLGVKPCWGEGIAKVNGKNCGTKYRVTWTSTLQCFNLQRKANRLPKKVRETQNWRYIIGVEPAGKRKMRCLTTSNPTHLYLFGNFNVTHNTICGLQITLTNAREGTPCAWFSLEMSKDKLTQRLYPQMSEIITSYHMRDPRSMNEETHISEVIRLSKELQDLPIWIDDSSSLPINKVIARMRMMRRKYGIRLYIVDYLQLIKSTKQNLADGIEEIMFSLRDLVKIEPIHVLLLSQYSKADGFSKKKQRSRSDLYGGSVIHHAAQNVLLLSMDDAEGKEKGELLDVEFRFDKQREGRTGKVSCMFDPDHLLFTYAQPPLRT